MNTPVSFPLAKLLNSKGLPGLKSFCSNKKQYALNPIKYTIGGVVMWLYEKHGIWVYLVPAEDNKEVFKPFFRGKNIIDQHLTEFFNSPTEAYEAAIEYTLNNLI